MDLNDVYIKLNLNDMNDIISEFMDDQLEANPLSKKKFSEFIFENFLRTHEIE